MHSLIFVPLVAGWFAGGPPPAATPQRAASTTPRAGMPWQEAWDDPPASCRPLQIVHGIDPRRARAEGIDQITGEETDRSSSPRGMEYYRELGLGGIVCNVAFGEYLRSEENWKTLVAGVESCARLGLRVWIYDEDGYPSGAAGGLVLEEHPAFEATVLAYDPSREPSLFTRPAYEHTHASNNFYAARRYPNLLDSDAVKCFVRVTHEAYRNRLERHLGETIEAFFTDEPSLMAVNLGPLPDHVRKDVRVVDAVDSEVTALPTVPWSRDLAEQYRQRYGEDLIPLRRSLFDGSSPRDRRTRRRFWSLVAELVDERFFGALQKWCREQGVASSGHTLWEEQILHHVPLVGSGLRAISSMTIPGLDLLSSEPEVVMHSGWLTAALPASAAMLSGRRKVMTEVSDFIQKMGGQGPAQLSGMLATAGWQASWGVTEFTLYYGISDRPADEIRDYCLFVGRLNSVLRAARLEPDVLLYYPIHDLWEEYLPRAEPLRLESQTPRAQAIVRSFLRLGQTLQRRQIPFCLVDHEQLARAEPNPAGQLVLAGRRFSGLGVPAEARLPAACEPIRERFAAAGGQILRGRLKESLEGGLNLEPPAETISFGRFARGDWRIFVLTNVGRTDYRGEANLALGAQCWKLDPATGSVERLPLEDSGRLWLSLASRQTQILIGR